MRDLSTSTTQLPYYLRQLPSGGWYGYNLSHEGRLRFRDDISHGVRRGDGFRHPTNYRVHDCRITSHEFSGVVCEPTLFPGIKYEFKGSSSTGGGANRYTPYTYCTGSPYPSPNPSQNLVNRVDTKVLNNMRNGDFDAGVALAELNKTAAFVVTSALRLRSMMTAIRQQNMPRFLNDLKHLLKDLRKKYPRNRRFRQLIRKTSRLAPDKVWLEYQYALVPLMYDIYGAIDTLNRNWTEFPPIMSAKSSATEHPSPNLTLVEIGKGFGVDGDAELGVEVGLYYSVSSEWLYGLNSVGLLNPAQIAWELVPYSFVFDWLVPIGQWLQAISAPLGLHFESGYRTKWLKMDLEYRYVPLSYRHISGELPRLTVDTFSMQRTKLSSFPAPKPYMKNPISDSHLLSSAALLTGRARVGTLRT